MNNFYVYIFLRPDKPGKYQYDDLSFDYEPFYIGKGSFNRIDESRTNAKSNSTNNIKCSIIDKISRLDLSIISIKLKENLSENEAFIYERYLISKIGRISGTKKHPVVNYGPLSNLTDGGEGFITKNAILMYNLDGILIKEFESLSHAYNETKILNISNVCNFKRVTAGRFIWRYKINNKVYQKIDTSYLNDIIHMGSLERSVLQYDIGGNFIKRYNSLKMAAKETGCSSSRISDVCKGIRKHTKKFIWKYEFDKHE